MRRATPHPPWQATRLRTPVRRRTPQDDHERVGSFRLAWTWHPGCSVPRHERPAHRPLGLCAPRGSSAPGVCPRVPRRIESRGIERRSGAGRRVGRRPRLRWCNVEQRVFRWQLLEQRLFERRLRFLSHRRFRRCPRRFRERGWIRRVGRRVHPTALPDDQRVHRHRHARRARHSELLRVQREWAADVSEHSRLHRRAGSFGAVLHGRRCHVRAERLRAHLQVARLGSLLRRGDGGVPGRVLKERGRGRGRGRGREGERRRSTHRLHFALDSVYGS
jgi:hypothetical protein